jgi:outer membrane receptor protein involved in Fe transport
MVSWEARAASRNTLTRRLLVAEAVPIYSDCRTASRSKGYALTAQLPNQNIKWEQVNQTDIGLDLGLFKKQLNLTADWYSRQTQDMIYQVPVPVSAGFLRHERRVHQHRPDEQ